MRAILRGLFAHRRGIAAVEFAVLAPVMLLLAGGIVDGGLLLRVYTSVNALSMQYVESYADCDKLGTCATEPATYAATNTLANVAPGLTASNLTLSMFEVTITGSTVSVINAYATNTGSPSLSAAQTSALLALVPAGAASTNTYYAVVVTATYQYSLQFFSSLMAPILGSSFAVSYTQAQLQSTT
jgi:Flp pilus assembly protein TadG